MHLLFRPLAIVQINILNVHVHLNMLISAIQCMCVYMSIFPMLGGVCGIEFILIDMDYRSVYTISADKFAEDKKREMISSIKTQ